MAQSGTNDPTIHAFQPDCYVLGFEDIDQTLVAAVGGKGAHLRCRFARCQGHHPTR